MFLLNVRWCSDRVIKIRIFPTFCIGCLYDLMQSVYCCKCFIFWFIIINILLSRSSCFSLQDEKLDLIDNKKCIFVTFKSNFNIWQSYLLAWKLIKISYSVIILFSNCERYRKSRHAHLHH